MTVRDLGAKTASAALSADDRERLALAPDAEHASILLRDLLAYEGVEDPSVNLSVAENVLLYDLVYEHVFKNMPALPEDYIKYFPSYGSKLLREGGKFPDGKQWKGMAQQLSGSFGLHENAISPQNVFGVAGVSSALQCIAWGLQTPLPGGVPAPRGMADPPVPRGSKVLLPAPYWQGFNWSFEQGPGLDCVPVQLTHNGEGNFKLALEDLTEAYDDETKLLVLTNPHNPLGVNYDKELLESIYEWFLKKPDVHIISDEMYCHSQIGDQTGPQFVSAFALDAIKGHEDRVHVVWGFAKDFGLSGFRAGFLISNSDFVHNIMNGSSDPLESRNAQSWFTPFDALKHFYILNLLQADQGGFWDYVMGEYRPRLTAAFADVSGALNEHRIAYVHDEGSNSAQFFWLDLREFLGDRTEEQLAEDIAENTGVKLLTGGTMHCGIEGFYRLCFTAVDTSTVVDGVLRMGEYLRTIS